MLMERCISGVAKSRWMHNFDSYRGAYLRNDARNESYGHFGE
jgi:hypothetical protein